MTETVFLAAALYPKNTETAIFWFFFPVHKMDLAQGRSGQKKSWSVIRGLQSVRYYLGPRLSCKREVRNYCLDATPRRVTMYFTLPAESRQNCHPNSEVPERMYRSAIACRFIIPSLCLTWVLGGHASRCKARPLGALPPAGLRSRDVAGAGRQWLPSRGAVVAWRMLASTVSQFALCQAS